MLRAVSYIILIVPGDLLYCTLWSETLIKQHRLLILHFPVFNFSRIIKNFSGLDIVKWSTTHCKRVNNSVTSIDVQKAITIKHLWEVYNYTFKTACRRRVPDVSLISFQFHYRGQLGSWIFWGIKQLRFSRTALNFLSLLLLLFQSR